MSSPSLWKINPLDFYQVDNLLEKWFYKSVYLFEAGHTMSFDTTITEYRKPFLFSSHTFHAFYEVDFRIDEKGNLSKD